MFLHILITASFMGADPQSGQLETKREANGASLFPERTGFLVKSLRTPLPLERSIESPLREVIEYLEDVSSPPEAAKDPGKKVKIIIDDEAFRTLKNDPAYRADEEAVRIPKLNGVSLETALRMLGSQIHGTYLVRNDYIEITTWEKVLGRPRKENEYPQLICWAAKKVPLEELVEQLGDRYQVSIVIAPQTAERGQTPITAKFLNVPLEDVIDTLAEMSSLKVVRKQRLFYITTPELAFPLMKEEGKPKLELQPEKKKPKTIIDEAFSTKSLIPAKINKIND
jgi:hypothetical protein